jgi:dienelactone hydrolase
VNGGVFKNAIELVVFGTLAVAVLAIPALAEPDADDGKAPTAPMHEQVLRLAGDPSRPVTLEATLFEPPGSGPFPLAVMNHGAEGTPRTVPRYRVSFSIDYLLSRGYAVVVPMMRGFAGSGGQAVVDGCDDASIGKLNATDMLAAIAAMKQRPEIDATRILVMGQSFGGWNSLALATLAPPEVRGVINFVGGIRSSRCDSQDTAMWEAMAVFGREARVSSLWFYGERDQIFPEKVWRSDYERFTQAGGHAQLIDFGDIDDAHNLLGHAEHLSLWVPAVDAYLAQRGLPNRVIYPEYMPAPPPLKTNYALIDDTASVPFIGRTHPEFYEKFRNTTTLPRALVVGPHGASLQSGGFDPVVRAMNDCHKQSATCILYAYDNDVVWTGPEAGQTARIDNVPIIGKAVKANASVMIEQFVSLSPDCTPRALPTLQSVQPPAHGNTVMEVVEDFPSFASTSPLAVCNGRKTRMLRLSYKSSPGFNGVDFLAMSVTEATKPAQTVKFAVHVN